MVGCSRIDVVQNISWVLLSKKIFTCETTAMKTDSNRWKSSLDVSILQKESKINSTFYYNFNDESFSSADNEYYLRAQTLANQETSYHYLYKNCVRKQAEKIETQSFTALFYISFQTHRKKNQKNKYTNIL